MIGFALNSMGTGSKKTNDVAADAKLAEDMQYLVAFGNWKKWIEKKKYI